MTFTFDLGS